MKFVCSFNFLKNQLFLIFLLLFIGNEQLLAQKKGKNEVVKDYGKASYTSDKTGTFFRTWLIAGPIPVHEDEDQNPDDILQ